MIQRRRILVVEDNPDIREATVALLEGAGYDVVQAADVEAGCAAIDAHALDATLLDIGLAGEPSALKPEKRGGARLMRYLRSTAPSVPVIVMTGDRTAETAIELMGMGALHYLLKPVKDEALLHWVEIAVAVALSRRPGATTGAKAVGSDVPELFIGSSGAMREVKTLIERFAPTEMSILILGATGTGKEVAANSIHRRSGRRKHAMRDLNCAALPQELIESELFGHEKGAFTSAMHAKKGMFEVADGSTIFLDEIGDMPPGAQSKLLRVLQTGKIRRVGGTVDIKVDVRVISATNRDLEAAVEEGDFRPDLYYRICGQPLYMPSLSQRASDIPTFAQMFVDESRPKHGTTARGLTERAVSVLSHYPWPGNVRQLATVVERAAVMATGCDLVGVEHLPPDIVTAALDSMALSPDGSRRGASQRPTAGECDHHGAGEEGFLPEDLPVEGLDLPAVRDAWEKRMIEQALARTGGNQTLAARELRLTREQLKGRMTKFGVGG